MVLLGTFFMLLMVCWSGQYVDGQEGIWLTLNNVQYTNNSVVTITDIGTGSAALLCTTTYIHCCLSTDGSQWYFPNGSAVQRSESLSYYRTRTFWGSGTVRLNRNPGTTKAGIFHCDIPDASGDLQSLYVGIYTDTTGSPSVTSLVYDSQSRTFTCTSTGGPATTVTWRRNGAVITLNATYQQIKTVVDRVEGTYQTVLTIDPSVGPSDIRGTYYCTVENARGRSSITVVITVLASVTAGGNARLGLQYTLICNVNVASGVTGTPTVQWVGPGSSAPIVTGGDFTVTNTSITSYILIINPLRQSHAGQYICQATVGGETRPASVMVDIPVPTITASIKSSTGPFTAGQSYTLTCTATVTEGDTLSTNTTTITWIHPGGGVTSGTGSSLDLSLDQLRVSDAGQYTCNVSVSSPFLSGAQSSTSMFTINVQVPTITASITTPTGPFTAGQSYTLTCTATVTGAGTMSTTAVTWIYPSGNVTSETGSSLDISLNPLRVSDAGQYTCNVSVSSPFLTGAQSSTDMFTINVQVPSPTVDLEPVTPGAVTYAGNNVTLRCMITPLGGVTDSDVTVNSIWTKDGAAFTGISARGRVTITPPQRSTGTSYITRLIFSPLSSSMDSGTYMCITTLTPRQPQFVTVNSVSASFTLAVIAPNLTVSLTANTTRLPNVAPYNTFSITCIATSSVDGVGNVALPKRFQWRRWYGPDTTGLTQLSSNATIQIQDGDNLTKPTSSSMLTVTEDIPQDYRYRCQVDLNLPADNIFTLTDVYPITVTGPFTPLELSNLMSTDVRHNRATIQWTVSMIAYTPETYTVHFGTSPGSLTPFSQQRQSGDNFTATNLPFSIQLTGLSAETMYYYQVVAVNSEGSNTSVEQSFNTTELPPTPPQMFCITSVTTTSLSFSWQMPMTLNGVLTGYQLSCQPLLSGIPLPQILNTTAVIVMLSGIYPGVEYNCSLVAKNSAGPSDPVYINGSTLETVPTGPPQNFTVSQHTARNITLSWSPPAPTLRNGVITGYSLSCVPETGAHGRDTTNLQYTAADTFTLGGFTPATSYNCSISASNSQGSGPATYLVDTTLEAPPDAPPQNIVVSLNDDFPEMLFFSWQPPPLNQRNGMITEYTIVCTPSGGGQHVEYVNDISLNATVMMFTPATQYNCAFTASTSAGPGVETVLPVLTLPASPENVTLTTNSSRLRVTWTINQLNGIVTNYTIYVTRLERGSTVVNYTSTDTQLLQFDVPNLDPYELVEVSVSASNSAGEGPRTTGVRGRTREEPPGIVSNCPSRWTDLANAIQVTWTAPERPNGMLLRYHIQLTTYDGRRVITTESVGSGTLVGQLDTSELEDGVPYIVSIFAENSAGNGTKCNVTDFTNELPPPAPRNVMVAHVSGTIVRVSWQPLSPVEARGHITYRVMVTPTTGSRRRRQATQGERVCTLLSPCEVPANESSVIVVGLDRNTSYSVTVMAVNSEGEDGPTSMPIAATIPTVPPTQMGVNIGTVVGVVVALVVVIIIMGVVIGVQMARNRRYRLTVQQHAVKDEPVKWSEVAGSSDTTIITTQYEAYATVDQGHEYEVLEHTAQRPPGPGYEIPVTKCPAYVPTSEQEGQRVEEAVYEL